MVQLTLILDNLRSSHNVGALLRTADSLGVFQVYACGITPYPQALQDARDPVVAGRNTRAIAKTALGAESSVSVEHFDDTPAAIAAARAAGCAIFGLEQTPQSVDIATLRGKDLTGPIALVVGNEVSGVGTDVLAACDVVITIPQRGRKESLNVAVAAGIALYQLLA